MTLTKRRWQWMQRSLIVTSVSTFLMSAFFAWSASISPDVGRVAVPVSLTLLAVSSISWTVAKIVKELVAHVRSLEVRLEKLEAASEVVQ